MSEQPVEFISTWIPFTDEMMVDYGIGTEQERAAAAARLDARERESERKWRALPWYIRWSRTFRMWRWSMQARFMGWLHLRLFPECEESDR